MKRKMPFITVMILAFSFLMCFSGFAKTDGEADRPVLMQGVFAGTRTTVRTEDSVCTDIAKVTVPVVELTEETAQEYPLLAQSLKAYTDESCRQCFSQVEKQAAVSLVEEKPYILRADSRVFSILKYNCYKHGKSVNIYRYRSVNFDSTTGKRLKLKDVVTDQEAFIRIARKKLESECQYKDVAITRNFLSLLDNIDNEDIIAWNLGYSGLQMIFSTSDAWTWDTGTETIMISWDEAPQLFNPQYSAVPDSWIMQQAGNIPVFADVQGNGKKEEIEIWDQEAYSGSTANFYRICRGDQYYDSDHFVDKAVYYLSESEGRYYMYAVRVPAVNQPVCTVVDLRSMEWAEAENGNDFISVSCSDWKAGDTGYASCHILSFPTDPEFGLPEKSRNTEPTSASEPNSAVLLRFGPGGLGKTTLIREVLTEAVSQDIRPHVYYGDIWTKILRIKLTEEAEKEYPRLAESLKACTEEQEKRNTEELEQLQTIKLSMEENSAGEGSLRMGYTMNPYILRADSRIFSILYAGETKYRIDYGDSTDISRSYRSENIDTVSGKRLILSDIVNSYDSLLRMVRKKAEEENLEWNQNFEQSLKTAFNGNNTDNRSVVWNLSYEGLILILRSGDPADGSGKIGTVTIAWRDAPELFEPYYAAIPDAWVMPIIKGVPYSVDFLGNGNAEKIIVTELEKKYYQEDYSVSIEGRSNIFEGFFEFAYLIRTGGQYYIYTFFDIEDGDAGFSVSDPKTMRIIGNGKISNYWQYVLITDPDYFWFENRFDMLSTHLAGRYYKVGSGGLPVPLEPYYMVYGLLRLKQPVNVVKIDEEGNETDTVELPAGSFIRCFRTDARSYMDIRLVGPSVEIEKEFDGAGMVHYYLANGSDEAERDWQLYRIRTGNDDEWLKTGNGLTVDDLFEGMHRFG